jgi:hypothetical protein
MRGVSRPSAPSRLSFTTFAILVLAAAGGAPRRAQAAGPAPAAERRISIIYTAEVHGALEPCGCTSDPLGDVSRFAEVVRAAKKDSGAVLIVDAGGLLYPEGGASARERPANDARAAFLAGELEKLGLTAAGIAETDLAGGAAAVRPKRLASNFAPAAVIRAPSVETVGAGAGAVKVGVLGVADPALGDLLGARGEDPARAARRDAERLRAQGAELVVLLAPVEKALARRIAREASVDFVVLGRQVGKGMPLAERVPRGDGSGNSAAAFLLAPADELQRIGRVDVVLRGARDGLVDGGGPEATRARLDEADRALKRLDDELARWSQASATAAGTDSSFIAAKKKERDQLAAEVAALAKPWAAPATGIYFVNRLIPLRRSLPRDPSMVAAMKKLDLKIAAINLEHKQPPPAAEPGRAAFVGVAACAKCHAAAVDFWKKTVHASAWKTLAGGKQADYKCIGCHLTGYGQVGGSALGFTRGLEAVQCENCHGPASLHLAAKGLEEPSSVHRAVPETTCLGCHNEKHSDTFQYQAYLRDVLGPGHGAEARKKLGAGPTGRELRAAAVAKAKRAGATAAPM